MVGEVIQFTATKGGTFSKTRARLERLHNLKIQAQLEKFGREGVAALAAATPVESGLTATSWYYKITVTPGSTTLSWHNSHMAGNTPVAILLQYGHGTGTGGYVAGKDFINPVIEPLFERIKTDVWKVVTSK